MRVCRMKILTRIFIGGALAFFVFVGLLIFYFFAIFECTTYPIDDIENPIQGDYEIVGLTQACPTARPHGEFYLKHKDDTSDGINKRDLIVESYSGHRVTVKWINQNVLQVTSYRDDSVRKIRKSVFGKEVRLESNFSWQDKK